MEASDVEKKLVTYRQACRKGTDWLLKFLNPDGSIGPVEERLFYYRVPWAFALMGELSAASRVLEWIRGHIFPRRALSRGCRPRGV